jgi:hypothetical protein
VQGLLQEDEGDPVGLKPQEFFLHDATGNDQAAQDDEKPPEFLVTLEEKRFKTILSHPTRLIAITRSQIEIAGI